jgi:hypothetical protein
MPQILHSCQIFARLSRNSRSREAMNRDFVLMVGDMQAVGNGEIRFAQRTIRKMRLERAAVAVEAGDGGAQAGGGGAPGQGWREHRCAGDGLGKRMAHLAAQLEDGEGGGAHGALKYRAFSLREAIHAHFYALGQMLQNSGERPCARGFHARRGL